MIQATFFMEQHVGLKTYYQNLRDYIETDSRISPNWVKITYEDKNDKIINQLPIPSAHIKGTLIGRKQTRIGLKKYHSDITFFLTQVPAMFGGRLLSQAPYVLCTDITPIQYDEMAEAYGHKPDKNGLISRYKRHVNTAVFHNAAHILPWSNWAKNSLIDHYQVAENKLSPLPIGLDLTLWQPQFHKRDPNKVKILFVGGDFVRKGGKALLNAFQNIQDESVELIIVTQTKLDPQKGVQVYHHLQPNSPELIHLFQSCDLFVLPTKADSFGIVAAEASATGLPVIMTDVGGVRDIVIDGKTGFLLPPDSRETLHEKLAYLVTHGDERRQMGLAAYEHAKTNFDALQNGKKIADLLVNIVTEKQTVRNGN